MKKRILAMVMALTLCLGLAGTAFASSGQRTVYASNMEELQEAVKQSNTRVVLEGKEYATEYGFGISGVSNVTVEGTEGTRIISNFEEDNVITIYNSQNISLVNLECGHREYLTMSPSCTRGVVYVYNGSANISNCDLFGCGTVGISAYGSVTVTDSTIRDCSVMSVEGGGGSFNFTNCTFSGNGYKNPDTYSFDFMGNGTTVTFNSCVFKNNKNPVLANDYSVLGDNGRTDKNVSFVYNNCFFSGNAWGNDTKATRASSSVLVNGEKKNFDAYSIGGNNYFKLRDLAYVLSGSEKQFEVGWDGASNAIALTSGAAYTPAGGEMAAGSSAAPSVTPASAKILVDGKEVSLTAYSIGGNNYFKLRDIGELFNFGIGWDAATSTITIDTSTGYTAG